MFRQSFLSSDQGNRGEGVLDRGIKFNMPLAKILEMVTFFVSINFSSVKSDNFSRGDENYCRRKINADGNYYRQSFYR